MVKGQNIYQGLLKNRSVDNKLKSNKDYKKLVCELDIIFYLLKKCIPQNKLKLLMKYDEIESDIHIIEQEEWFKQGTKNRV